jgi:hypothetical protein
VKPNLKKRPLKLNKSKGRKQRCRSETAQLSMHAVQATSSKVNTFVLQVYIGKVKATALVDTGRLGVLVHS